MADECSALYCGIDLGGVETECTHVAVFENGLSVDFYAEGVGCVINNFKAVGVGNFLDALHIAWVAVNMHWHNGRCFWGDGCFDFFRIDKARFFFNIHKYGL